MQFLYYILSTFCLLSGWDCQLPALFNTRSVSRNILPLIPKSDTSETEKKNRLFAFVGEKIAVTSLPHERGSMDAAFRAKYKVLERVYGYYPYDIIEFKVYDHYGKPDFSGYKNVLLFVSEYEGKYYHEKYQFYDVYKTNNGRWASPYKAEDYEHIYNKNTTIKPQAIKFEEKVILPNGDSAITAYGNYLEELFALKKSGVLAARGLFDVTPEQEEADVLSAVDPPTKPPDTDDRKFMAFWKTFAASVKEPGLKAFKRIALDSLLICNERLATGDFINKCFTGVFDEEAMKRIGKSTGKEYTVSNADFTYLSSHARKEILKFGDGYRFRQTLVARSSRNNQPSVIVFDFIETRKGYRLYGVDHYSFKTCCR